MLETLDLVLANLKPLRACFQNSQRAGQRLLLTKLMLPKHSPVLELQGGAESTACDSTSHCVPSLKGEAALVAFRSACHSAHCFLVTL